MATLKLRALDSGFLELYTLAWPPETAGLDDATISMAMVVLLRPGGFLLALPNGAIPPEDLAAAAVQEEDALLGPHHVFSVPGFRDDGPDQPEDDQEVEVLVVDVSTEILPAMARYSEVDGATLCFSDDPSLLPSPEPLLVMVRQWLLMQASTKAAFHSAEEEMVPETPAEAIEDDEDKEGVPEEPEKPVAARKSNAKPKRVTTASLAEQMTAVTQMLPSIADRLDSLQREQQVMRSQISSREFLVPPRPSQQPVSTSLANFAKMVGSASCEGISSSSAEYSAEGSPSLSPFDGWAADPPGTGGGAPCTWRVNVGDGSSGAEQGFNFTGESFAVWRRSIVGCSCKFLRILSRVKGCSRQREVADRAFKQIWQLLLGCDSKCLEEIEACSKDATRHRICCLHGLLNGDLLRKVRWLRWFSRDGFGSVLHGAHLRCCTAGRLGRHPGTPGADDDSSRAECYGRRSLGFSVSTHATRGASGDVMDVSPDFSQPQGESFLTTMPATVGDRCPRISERSRLYPEQTSRPDQSSNQSVCSRCPVSQPQEEVESEEQGISRSSGRVDGLCGFGRSHDEFEKVHARDFFGDEGVSFDCWVEGQVRRILASRSAFSFFCMKSICSCRSGRYGTASTALFPIPVPYLRAWTSARGRGAKQRRSQALQKLLNMAVMALNFEYLRSPLSVVHLLRRPPAAHHHRVFERLGWFIKACATTERISYLGCGRKSFQFGARVNELVNALTKIGAVSSSPYSRACSVGQVPLDNESEVAEELRPYRDLEPSRLRLTGQGQWNCEDYLSDYLWLVFKEPRANCFDIRPPRHLVPDVTKEKKQKIFELCQVWDKQELLTFCPVPALPDDLRLAARVFNNYKNTCADRQIGDRRGQNFREGVLQHGQSRYLPSGASLLQLCPLRYHEELVGAVTDRRDYYHQFSVSFERASTNFLYPFFRVDEIRSFGAYGKLFEEWGGSSKKRRKREVEGDYLGIERPSILWSDDLLVAPCFSSLFQGDHLGVEFATESHSGMLVSYGLLSPHNRLQAGVCLQDDRCAQGLYIDDFFAISREKLGEEVAVPHQAMSSLAFHRAKEAYAAEEVFGSDDKDVLGSRCFRVVGAEVDSRRFLVDGGVVSCGLPAEKRLALANVASIAASLPVTSDALHSSLVGSIISMLMYRRPAMSALQEVFHVIPPSELDTLEPKMWKLSRAAASELAVISALAPILVTNLAVPALPKLFATDASLAKGGITEAEIGPELAKLLWRDADRRGSNVPIHSRARAVLRSSDPWFEETGEAEFRPDEFPEEEWSSGDSRGGGEGVQRPIGLCFDFFEVCGGSGVVTKRLASMGVTCGPILDLTYSPHYDLTENRLLAWALFMMEQRRVKAFLVAPPCTTFSPAAHPALRSYKQPEGYSPSHPRVKVGNLLAYASLCLLFAGLRLKIFGLGEQPRRSKMRWLKQWRRLLALGAREAFLASCMYGSVHQKEFCFVGVNMKVELLERRCSRDHDHIRIEGRYTRASAVYCDGLADALARFFRDHLSAHERAEERFDLQVAGLEDQMSNELCLTLDWRTSSSWKWKGSSHVNLLETAATLKLYRTIALDGGDARFTYLGDSHVSRSSLARGRTSSHAMRPLLRQASSLCLAYGLYPAGRYAPTRWNPSDHPTRDTQIPTAIPQRLLDLPARDLIWICSLPKLKRWASNWVRLVWSCLPILLQFLLMGFLPGGMLLHGSFHMNGVWILTPALATLAKDPLSFQSCPFSFGFLFLDFVLLSVGPLGLISLGE